MLTRSYAATAVPRHLERSEGQYQPHHDECSQRLWTGPRSATTTIGPKGGRRSDRARARGPDRTRAAL